MQLFTPGREGRIIHVEDNQNITIDPKSLSSKSSVVV
jgi:hypothetical protein